MSNKLKIFLTFSLILTSCATGGFKPNVVPRDAAGKSQIVLSGTVVSVKEVIMRAKGCWNYIGRCNWCSCNRICCKRSADGDGETSELIGGIVGGLVGSVVGSEVGGHYQKEGLELIILLENNGKEISVVQKYQKT